MPMMKTLLTLPTLTLPTERGRANDALIALLAREFKVAKSSVRIVIGKTAREKLVEID